MTRKRFLSALPFLGALAARLRGSEPMVKVDVAPKPKTEPECVPVDFTTLLWAIGQVENGSDSKPSVRGERSKYQITAAVWRQHEPRMPFTECKGGKAWLVALNHLHWLDRHIPRVTLLERYERSWCLAYAWNAGLSHYLGAYATPANEPQRNGASMRAIDYGMRVHAIFKTRLNSKHA